MLDQLCQSVILCAQLIVLPWQWQASLCRNCLSPPWVLASPAVSCYTEAECFAAGLWSICSCLVRMCLLSTHCFEYIVLAHLCLCLLPVHPQLSGWFVGQSKTASRYAKCSDWFELGDTDCVIWLTNNMICWVMWLFDNWWISVTNNDNVTEMTDWLMLLFDNWLIDVTGSGTVTVWLIWSMMWLID